MNPEEEPRAGCSCLSIFSKKETYTKIKPRQPIEKKGFWASIWDAPAQPEIGKKDHKIKQNFEDRHSQIIAEQEERKAKQREIKYSTVRR